MHREIVTAADTQAVVKLGRMAAGAEMANVAAAAQAPPKADDYVTKLAKYIPAEAIGLYLFIAGLAASQPASTKAALLWFGLIFGLLFTPFYHWSVGKARRVSTIMIPTIAFAVWVYNLGGPFAQMSWYTPVWGSVALAAYTTVIPLVMHRTK